MWSSDRSLSLAAWLVLVLSHGTRIPVKIGCPNGPMALAANFSLKFLAVGEVATHSTKMHRFSWSTNQPQCGRCSIASHRNKRDQRLLNLVGYENCHDSTEFLRFFRHSKSYEKVVVLVDGFGPKSYEKNWCWLWWVGLLHLYFRGVRYLGRLAHPKSYQLNANFPIQHVFVGSV